MATTYEINDRVVTPDRGRIAVIKSIKSTEANVVFEDDGTKKKFNLTVLRKVD